MDWIMMVSLQVQGTKLILELLKQKFKKVLSVKVDILKCDDIPGGTKVQKPRNLLIEATDHGQPDIS